MKEEKQKLVLNKRTVAHLNNMEMRHVRGGDGGEGETIPTRGICGDETKLTKSIRDAINIALSAVVYICNG